MEGGRETRLVEDHQGGERERAMEVTLNPSPSRRPSKSAEVEAFRSLTKDCAELRCNPHGHPLVDLSAERQQLLEEFLLDLQNRCKLIEEEDLNVDALEHDGLEAYSDALKKELHSIQEENDEVSDDIESLISVLTRDSARLDVDFRVLENSLRAIDSQGFDDTCTQNLHSEQRYLDLQENAIVRDGDMEIMELDCQIAKYNSVLRALMLLEQNLRSEEPGMLEGILSGVRVIEYEESYMKLLLQTSVEDLNDILLEQKLGPLKEPIKFDHEIIIEFNDDPLQIKNVKILPDNVTLDQVVHSAKCSRHSLCWLFWHIRQAILLSSLRHLVVSGINDSRRSVVYTDSDETVLAHLIGGVDAYIEIPQGWPISDFGLKLISVISINKESFLLEIICKIKERANSLDMHIRHHLARFVDAIENIIIQEMQQKS